MTATHVRLAPVESTVLWDGDAVVLGASLAGISFALAAAGRGLKTCLVEPGPALGTEVSRMWMTTMPAGGLSRRILDLCATRNARRGDQADMLVATLAFDHLVENAQVRALVRVQPVRPLAGPEGCLLGVEVVGKSGRQALRAPLVVDATPARQFSRRALSRPEARVVTAERRLYVYGAEIPDGGLEFAVPAGLGIARNRVFARPAVWSREAILTFQMKIESALGMSEIQERTLAGASAVMECFRKLKPEFSGCLLVDVASECRFEFAPDDCSFDELRDTGLYPLALAADTAGEIARAESAAQHLTPPRPAKRLPAARAAGNWPSVAQSELSAAADRGLPRIVLPEAEAALHPDQEIVVAGCGAGGSFAALAAAESKARVTVIEAMPLPGGIGTAGRIHTYYYGLGGGLQPGMDRAVDETSAPLGGAACGFHPVGKARTLSRALASRGVNILTCQSVFGVIKEGRRIKAVISAAADGYHAFPCVAAIDATGDGDLAAAAGAAFSFGRAGDGFPQPYSNTPSLISDGKLSSANFDIGWLDPTDTLDYSRAHFEGRRRIWDHGPFSDKRHYCTLAVLIGVRESRFIRGGITLKFEDFMEGRTYPDTVCEGYAHYDNHAVDLAQESEWARRHVVMFGLWAHLCRGHLPYRALLPDGLDGLLLACRALSVEHDLHQLLRMQPDMQKIGEVCGAAAALAIQTGTTPARLDPAELRRMLAIRGVLPERDPEAALGSATPAVLLGLLGTYQGGLAMWRLSRLAQDQQPDWNAFFAAEADPDKRFRAAVAAVLGGTRNADARETLQMAIRARLAEPALGFRSPPRYVVAALALAESHEPGIADRLGEILLEWQQRKLDAPTLLLLLQAIGKLGDPRGVETVKAFLKQSEAEDFPCALSGNPPSRTVPFRFALVLRSVRTLLELGCRDQCERLTPYLNDGNLLIRRYAGVLAKQA